MSLQNSNNIISSAPLPSSPPNSPPPLPARPGSDSSSGPPQGGPAQVTSQQVVPSQVASPVPSSAPPNYVPPPYPYPYPPPAAPAAASSSPISPGLIEDVYSGAASYGIFRALISAIGATVIGGLLIGLGVYIVKMPQKTSIQATITQINGATGPTAICSSSIVNKSVTYSCQLTVQYTYQGQQYTQGLSYNGSMLYSVGQAITIYITSDNPKEVSLSQTVSSTLGWVLIVFGALVIGGGWLMFWAAKKWKIVAAAEGAQGIASMFGGSHGGYNHGYSGGGYNGGGGSIAVDNPFEDIKLF